jgi:hypothetical protein
VEQFDESFGIGKYPVGHFASTVDSTSDIHIPLIPIVVPDGHTLRTFIVESFWRLHLILSTGNST